MNLFHIQIEGKTKPSQIPGKILETINGFIKYFLSENITLRKLVS